MSEKNKPRLKSKEIDLADYLAENIDFETLIQATESEASFDAYEINYEKNIIRFFYTGKSKQITFDLKTDISKLKNKPDLEPMSHQIILAIGLCLFPQVFLMYRPARLTIKAGDLTKNQLNFWAFTYEYFLREFFFVTGLPFIKYQITNYSNGITNDQDYLYWNASSELASEGLCYKPPSLSEASQDKVLLLYGGGKDCITLYDLLSKFSPQKEINFYLGTYDHRLESDVNRLFSTIKASMDNNNSKPTQSELRSKTGKCFTSVIIALSNGVDFPTDISINRSSPAWNAYTYLAYDKGDQASVITGVNDFSPCIAVEYFIAVIHAIANDIGYVITGNERSASYDNAVYEGKGVNHQFEKCLFWEKALTQYIKKYINSSVHFFSGLQHLWEIQIIQHFAKLQQYHNIFLSCNMAFTQDKWCLNCFKCLFIYLCLAAFLEPKKCSEIFYGNDLFTNQETAELLKQLLLNQQTKPLECIGTFEEIKLCLCLAREQYIKAYLPIPDVLVEYAKLYEDGIKYKYLLNDDSGPRDNFPEWFLQSQSKSGGILYFNNEGNIN